MPMRMDTFAATMSVHAIIMAMAMFMNNCCMNMGMRMLFINKKQCAADHQNRGDNEKERRKYARDDFSETRIFITKVFWVNIKINPIQYL